MRHRPSCNQLYPRPQFVATATRRCAGRVAAGAIAEKYLKTVYAIDIVAFVSSVGKIELPSGSVNVSNDQDDDDAHDALSDEFRALLATVTRADVDKHLTRCPHAPTADKMAKVRHALSPCVSFGSDSMHTRIQRILRARDSHDSIGGTITCVVRGVPAGLGEPVFDKTEAMLAHAMLSLPAVKAFEIGSGFKGTTVPGSRHNDPFVLRPDGRGLGTTTNWSGGVQGGITNGEDIYFRSFRHFLLGC